MEEGEEEGKEMDGSNGSSVCAEPEKSLAATEERMVAI